VNSKRSKAKRKERVQKDAQCSANRGGEREREEKKKERKNKEIGNCLLHTRYALNTPPGVYFI